MVSQDLEVALAEARSKISQLQELSFAKKQNEIPQWNSVFQCRKEHQEVASPKAKARYGEIWRDWMIKND